MADGAEKRVSCRSVEAVGTPSTQMEGLADETLLEICRVSETNEQVTPEWMHDLRLVQRLVSRSGSRQSLELQRAVTLLAALLGDLHQYNPVHLPFGYSGPRIQSHNWIDRETLEGVAKQIVGFLWLRVTPDAVAIAVQNAVTQAVHLGFLQEREYDAWRPGMRSGSGWRSAVMATPYGAAKARTSAEAHEAATPPLAPNVLPRLAEAEPESACETPQAPPQLRVQLGRPGEPCTILGKSKKPLTHAQHAVISALLKAGEEGLCKDSLENVRPSARRILKTLRQDPDWAEVILMPGQTNGRYRIRS